MSDAFTLKIEMDVTSRHRFRARLLASATYLILAWLVILLSVQKGAMAQNRKIAVFGSSVAKGSGDTTNAGGYAGIIGAMLENKGWNVVNLSKGGDNTTKIQPRFDAQLLEEKPDYVIIGLSLGNEGIGSSSELTRNRVFEKFRNGMVQLVKLCRENGMYPVVVNCYARNDFQSEQYDATRKMNLIINTWDVPSVNVLGAIDNGKGNWVDGYWYDRSHPNWMGHQEMAYTFVPSLFDAIESGKPTPVKIRSNSCLLLEQTDSPRPLSYLTEDPVHSFSVSFLVKTSGSGAVAALRGGETSLVELREGTIVYRSSGNGFLRADTTSENDGWQYVVLSHQYASGKTSFYVNGNFIGQLNEHLDLKEVIIGGSGSIDLPAPVSACYKDLLIYRSSLNNDEVKALYFGQLLQSSLEVYAPLNDEKFVLGDDVVNYAQSLAKVIVEANCIAKGGN